MPAKWTTALLIVTLFVAAVLSGYNYVNRPLTDIELFAQLPTPEPTPSVLPSPTPVSAVQVVSGMSPEERIAQLFVLPAPVATVAARPAQASGSAAVVTIADLTPVVQQRAATPSAIPNPGGFLIVDAELSRAQTEQLLARPELQGPISSAAHLRPLILVDHEGGSVQRLSGEGFTQLPAWQELCSLPKVQRIALLDRSAAELKSVGVDMVLAPVLDRAAESAVYADRICANDVTLISLSATDYVQSFSQAGVLPVFKHYPGIGQTKYDLHARFDVITASEVDLNLFRSLLSSFPQVPVMIGHVGVSEQNPDVPCSLSPTCVGEVLRESPDRLIVTDALDMAAARSLPGGGRRSLAAVVLDAVAAGNSLLVLGERVTLVEQSAVFAAVLAEYKTNATFAIKVDEAARKVVSVKLSIRE